MAELNLTKDTFEQEVLKSDKPVLVDFWAPWCNPCRMMGPVIEQFAQEYEGKYKVAKVNVEQEAELAQQYGIMSIPSILVFKNGGISSSTVGYTPKDILIKLVEQN